jgi:hypothetical protein
MGRRAQSRMEGPWDRQVAEPFFWGWENDENVMRVNRILFIRLLTQPNPSCPPRLSPRTDAIGNMNNVYTAPAAPVDDSTSQDAGTAPAALTTHAHHRGGDVSGPSTSVPAATTSDPSIPSESGLTSQHKTQPTSLVAAAVPGAAGAHEEVAGQPSYVAELGPPLGAGGSMSAPFSVVRKANVFANVWFPV